MGRRFQASKQSQTNLNLSELTQGLINTGLPSVIYQTFVPKLLVSLQNYPRTFKVLKYLLAFLSTVGAITFGIKPLLESLVWRLLPVAELYSGDALYPYLRQYIDPKAYPVIPNRVQASIQCVTSLVSTGNDSDDDETEANSKDKFKDIRRVTYSNPSPRIFMHKGTVFVMNIPEDDYYSHEQIEIRAFAFTHAPIRSLLEHAWSTYKCKAAKKTTVIAEPNEGDWRVKKVAPIRPLDTIDIDDNEKTKIIDDITNI